MTFNPHDANQPNAARNRNVHTGPSNMSHTPESGKPLKPVTPRRRKIVIISVSGAVVVVGGLLLGFSLFRAQMITKIFDNFKLPPTVVAVTKVETGSLTRRLAGIGSLSAAQQTTISPQLGGRVTKIMFEAGRFVQAGDPLVQLDDSQERASLAQFESQKRLAKLTLDRSKALADQQFSSQAALDSATTSLEVAEANIQNIQAQISQKLIKAPFSGQLGVRQVELGQYVSPGTNLVTLTDLSRLYVNFSLPEQKRSKIQIGQSVTVTSNSLPGERFTAQLRVIEPQVDVSTRQISLQAVMANPGRKLLPGMYVDAVLNIDTTNTALTLPETAIDYSIYGESVYRVVKSDGKPVKQAELPALIAAQNAATKKDASAEEKAAAPNLKVVRVGIKTGEADQGQIEILSGIEEGDVVVEAGQNRLHDQSDVIISSAPSSLVPPAQTPVP
ncbi:MAG: efflux RND transporter periplasmic adaptor subunit [Candidatus Symbiobacter sp.]|nr:efflux RND transporter periplasmic adaptor subunit [Candidatus Symbiobacter sp.]